MIWIFKSNFKVTFDNLTRESLVTISNNDHIKNFKAGFMYSCRLLCNGDTTRTKETRASFLRNSVVFSRSWISPTHFLFHYLPNKCGIQLMRKFTSPFHGFNIGSQNSNLDVYFNVPLDWDISSFLDKYLVLDLCVKYSKT